MRSVLLMLIGVGLVSISNGEGRRKPQKPSHAKAAPRIHYDLTAVNNPSTMDRLEEKAEGSAVLGQRASLSAITHLNSASSRSNAADCAPHCT